MIGSYEMFVVVEINERHGFARVRSERTGDMFHTELVPEGHTDRLRVGDRIKGMARGQNVGRVSWVARAPPSPEAVSRANLVLADLARFGFQLPMSAEQLADAEDRAGQAAGLTAVIHGKLPVFFDEAEAADASLLERFEAAMAPHVPGFRVKPVAKEAKVVVEPDARMVHLGPISDPLAMFDPLLQHANERLETAKAKVRWVPIRRNWMLGSPAMVRVLETHGLVQPRTIH